MKKSNNLYFKIKENSILLKATAKKNFVFQIENIDFNSELFNKINSKETCFESTDEILKQGGRFTFKEIDNKLFNNNLLLIDSYLPQILSYLIIYFYTTRKRDIKELTTLLTASNPALYPISNDYLFYQYKIKSFLFGLITGLSPNEDWSGDYDSRKILTVVKDNEETLNFNLYDKDTLREYLYQNTCIDTIRTDSYECEMIEKQEDGTLLCKLKLQVRLT